MPRRAALRAPAAPVRPGTVHRLIPTPWPQRGYRGRVAQAYVGISGWRYAGWRGDFYPPGLPQRRELAYAAERLPTIEINGSFYSLQRPASYARWRRRPRRLRLRGQGRPLHHPLKKLHDVETPLANFFASGVLALGREARPGAVAAAAARSASTPTGWPPSSASLPRHHRGRRARRRHDDRLDDRALTTTDARPAAAARPGGPARAASRPPPRCRRAARRHRRRLVVADTAGRVAVLERRHRDFLYVRLHGDTELYVSGYTDAALDRWTGQVRAWATRGRDVFVYFDNDAKVRAPIDAMGLRDRLGIRT